MLFYKSSTVKYYLPSLLGGTEREETVIPLAILTSNDVCNNFIYLDSKS